jgi:hypothetical protein
MKLKIPFAKPPRNPGRGHRFVRVGEQIHASDDVRFGDVWCRLGLPNIRRGKVQPGPGGNWPYRWYRRKLGRGQPAGIAKGA